MTTLTVHLPRPHREQARIIREARRFNVLACGRRFGKSVLCEDRLVGPALEGKPTAYFIPTYKMLTEIWRDVRRILQPVTVGVDKQQHRIDLISGGVVDMWSLETPDAARGRKYARALIDEAAMVADLGNAWQAVIRPTLVDLQGDAWFASTPRGRNAFQQMFEWGQDPAYEEWMSWQMPTTANPYIDPAEVEAMRLTMPERLFEQEVMAAFLDDAGGVFRRVRESATAVRQERAQEGHQYAAGVDWGKHNDFTVITVVDITLRALVAMERFNQIDYTLQMGRLKAAHQRFHFTTVVAEANSMGDPLIEQAIREGLPVEPFTTTNATKKAAIEALALALERAEFTIIDDPVLVNELQSFQAERLPSGLLRYAAPVGMHDDCVMSAALAYQAISQPPAADIAGAEPELWQPKFGMGMRRR